MRARALGYAVVGCAAALGLTWEIGQLTVPATPRAAPAAPAAPATPTTAPSSHATRTSARPSASPRGASGPSGTFPGATAQTPYGPVQVAIVVKGGRITNVKALQLTDQGERSVLISQQAVPVLRSEALRAQSAQIAAVSGASYTSDGYIRSLQSAIDKAGL